MSVVQGDGSHHSVTLIISSESDEVPLVGPASTTSQGITNWKLLGAILLIANAALGAGLLNTPLAYSQAGGYGPGNLVHVVFFIATLASLFVLVEVACRFPDAVTYQEMVYRQCGKVMSTITSLFITGYSLITCVAFLILIGDQTDRYFADVHGPHFCESFFMDRKVVIIIAALLLFLFLLQDSMASITAMGWIGVLTILYLTVVIVLESQLGGYEPGERHWWNVKNPYDVLAVLPTISFGYQCHVSCVPILNTIKGASKAKYRMVVFIAMIFCFVIYTIGANAGYYTFGSNVKADILSSYDYEHWGKGMVVAALFALGFKSYATYPVLMYCVREAVLDLTQSVVQIRGNGQRFNFVVFLLWGSTVATAVLVKDISVVVRILGCLAAVFIYIVPAFCQLVHYYRSMEQNEDQTIQDANDSIRLARLTCRNVWRFALVTVLIVVGVFVFFASLVLTFTGPSPATNTTDLCIPSNKTNFLVQTLPSLLVTSP